MPEDLLLTRVDSARKSVSGRLAAWAGALGLAGFAFVPWLAYLPAIAALGLFAVVIWCAAWSLTEFAEILLLRLLIAALLGVVGTAAFWQFDDLRFWFAVPAVAASCALLKERRLSWTVAWLTCAVYAALFLIN